MSFLSKIMNIKVKKTMRILEKLSLNLQIPPLNKYILRIVISLLIFLFGSAIAVIGFYQSMPILMVIGLLIIGLLFIYIFKRFNLKLIAMLLTFTYVPAVALLWPLVHHFHFLIIDNSKQRLESIARSQAVFVDSWLEQRKSDIFFIENNIHMLNSLQNSNEEEENINKLRNILLKVKNSSPVYKELFILGKFKSVVVSTDQSKEGGFDSGMVDVNLGQEPVLSNLSLEQGVPVIFLSKCIKINNEQYVMGIKYSLSELQKAYGSIRNPDRPERTIKISLIDEKGYYIFTTDNSMTKPLKDKIYENFNKYLQTIKNMDLKYENDKGENTVGSYTQVESTGWYVISEQTFKEIIYNVDKNLMDVFIIMIINFIVVLLFAPFFSRGVTKPIRKIRDLAARGSSGDLSIQIEKGKPNIFEYKEAEETILAFNKMITTLNILKNSLESKIAEKTQMAEQLRETNEELNAQQEELTYLNEMLIKTNEQLNSAYKDLKQTQTKLVQHEKMASLGMLVAGVAHEINNPLGAISSNLSIYESITRKLEKKSSEDNEIKQIIHNIESVNHINSMACERIVKIVRSLRSFARLDEADFKEADIYEGIEDTLIILNHRLKNKVELVKEFSDIPKIKCYPNQLNQVFMNIFANAIDAIKEKGTIWIKTYCENNKIYIKIKDNGTGIKPEHVDKIFDPGFTTKGVGVGTGLGLSIVYNIIEGHKGNISVTSEVGKGTEFIIELTATSD